MTDEKEYKYHQCKQLNQSGVEIIYCNFYDEQGDEKHWWLHIYKEASEEDVMDGEADEVNEILCSNAIVISYCPFCGQELTKQQQ